MISGRSAPPRFSGVPPRPPSWPPPPPSLRPHAPPRKTPGKLPLTSSDMPVLAPRWPRAPNQGIEEALASKKPRLDNYIKPGDAKLVSQMASMCNKGCLQQGWTIDQFCEICHGATGASQVPGLSPGPHQARLNDHGSSSSVAIPSLPSKGLVKGCIRGNGLCPLGGWSIGSHCDYCHN